MREGTPVWCVSSQSQDYELLAKVCAGWTTLGQTREFRILNGGFVWNQHKDKLRATEDETTLPLVSSVSIGAYQLTFPPHDARVAGRLFVDVSSPLPGPSYDSVALLVKRTTPHITRGRRIVSAIVSDGFLERYPSYLAENHVNVVLPEPGGAADSCLVGLCAWLNSRLANFAFGMMNVSSHLSKFDLSLVPLPISLLPELSRVARGALEAPEPRRREVLDQVDECLFGFLELSPKEIGRVLQVVPPAV